MHGRRLLAASVGCLLMVTAAAARVPDDPLADVERLYASAAFEEALAALGRVGGPNPVFAYRMYRGTLEVVVGEDGAVESRAMSEPAFPSYDRELLEAAHRWKYTPALKDGRPVKFRKVIAVTLGGV